MNEQLGIIKNVGFGCRDMGIPVLFFDIYISESGASSQVLKGKQAMDLIKSYGVYDVKDLNGLPIWVSLGGGYIKIVRAWKVDRDI